MRIEKYKDGELVEVIDTRTLDEAQQELIVTVGQQLEANILAALDVDDPIKAAFTQINAMQGWYDADTNARINATVKSLRDKYYAIKADILALATVDDVANYQVTW